MTVLFRLALLVALFIGTPHAAMAHLTPNSEITLAVSDDHVLADIIIPQGEYAFATENPVGNTPDAIAQARAYLLANIRVTGRDGSPWTVTLRTAEFAQIAGPPDLHATALLTPPPGQAVGAFRIRWTALVDDLPNHFALFVKEAGAGEREILGAVRSGTEWLSVDPVQHPLSVFASAVGIGVSHIAEGYDHVLFLLALLLPAPLLAAGGRWASARTVGGTLGVLLKIVTAFTIGHSMTLVAATLGGWSLPVAPVEIAIAVSVLLSAVHAIRPIFPGREAIVAGLFGLVHGLAFATLVKDAGANMASSAAGLLGFNVGIEIVQLGVVVCVAPMLVIAARHRGYALIRNGFAVFCIAASIVWIVERSTGAWSGAGLILESLFGVLRWAVLLCAGGAIVYAIAERMARLRNARQA